MTEQWTGYPIPPWPQYRDDMQFGWADKQILERLGAIEGRLSRIEELLSKSHDKE